MPVRPNRLAEYRRATELTQDQVADRLQEIAWASHRREITPTRELVSKFERGTKRVSRFYRELFCRLYDATADDLGLRPGRPASGSQMAAVPAQSGRLYVLISPGAAIIGRYPGDGSEDVNRRKFLRLATLGGVGMAIDPERLAAAWSASSRVDRECLDDLQILTGQLVRQWTALNPRLLLPAILQTAALLQASMPGRTPEVARLLGEALVTAGWLSSLLNNYGDAAMYWNDAQRLAAENGDGYVLGLTSAGRSTLHSGIEHGGRGANPALALHILDQGLMAAGSEFPALGAFVLARRAEVHALLKDEAACRRDLDASQDALAFVTQTDRGGLLHTFGSSQLAGFHGSCFLLLENAPAAIDAINDGLWQIDSSLVPQRAAMMADLGAAYADDGEIEHACALLGQSLSDATKGGADQRRERIVGIRLAHLHRWSDASAVKQLDEQLAALTI